MSDPSDDTAFDEYLKGSSLVSQRYRQLGGEEVPPELDRRILNQAHVEADRPVRSRMWMRWGAPLAVAASAVLVLSIVLDSDIRQETALISESQTMPDAATDAEHEYELAPAAPPEGALDKRLKPIVPPAPAPVAAVPEAASGVERAPVAEAPPSPPQARMQMKRAETRAVRAGSAQDKAAVARFAASTAAEGRSAETGAAQASEVVVTGNRRRDAAYTAPVQADMPIEIPPPASIAVPAPSVAQAVEPRAYSDPQQWLEDIRQLRKDGKTTDADREWERFRAAFPDYTVAADDLARKKEAATSRKEGD